MTLGRSLLSKLSRPTSSGKYIPEIDGLRCLAIAAVIAFHLAGYVAEKTPTQFDPPATDTLLFRLLRTGHIGVQLFFIISGFVVALPFANERLAGGKPVQLRRYFLRRLTRIEPPYIIALIFWLLAFGVSGLGKAPFPVLIRHFPASLFYLHNLIYSQPSFVLPPAWSLEIEIQFYLLAPLLTRIFCVQRPMLRRSILSSAIIAIALIQPIIRTPDQINGLHLGHEAHYFLIGLLLVDFYLLNWKQTAPRYPMLNDLFAVVSFLALPLALLCCPNQLLIALLLLIFVAATLRSKMVLSIFQNPWIYTFGGMCYTTYLYHGFFKALPGHFTIRWQIGHTFWVNFLVQSTLLLPIIIIGSIVLYVLIERPFMGSFPPRPAMTKLSDK